MSRVFTPGGRKHLQTQRSLLKYGFRLKYPGNSVENLCLQLPVCVTKVSLHEVTRPVVAIPVVIGAEVITPVVIKPVVGIPTKASYLATNPCLGVLELAVKRTLKSGVDEKIGESRSGFPNPKLKNIT